MIEVKDLHETRDAEYVEGLEVDGANIDNAPSAANWKDVLEAAIRGEAADKTLSWHEALGPYARSILWSFGVSLCVVMQGYDMALIGSLIGLPIFREKYGSYSGKASTGYQLNPSWQAAVGQASQIGMFCGVTIASYFLPRYGHKRVLQVALLFMSGFVFIVFFSPNITVLFIGEVLCGLPWGTFSSTVVSYASEVAPVALRGYFTSYINGCNVIGQLIAAGIVVGVDGRQDKWAYKIPFSTQWFWPIPLFIIVTLAPESPWWLVRHGRLKEAERSILRLGKQLSSVQAANTVAMMIRTNQHEIDNSSGSAIWDCFKRSDLRRTEIGVIGFGIQFWVGLAISGVYFFEQAGLPTADAFKVNLGMTAMGLIGTTVIAWTLQTYVGRRKIYLMGCFNGFLLMLLVGLLAIPSAQGNSGAKWGQAVLMFLFNLNFQSTIGPIGYSILGETSSTRLRAYTIGISRNMHSVFSVASGYIGTYQISAVAWNWKGYAGFFWAGTNALCFVWTYFRLPEFQGRTYRELDIMFEKGVPARRFKTTDVDLESHDDAA